MHISILVAFLDIAVSIHGDGVTHILSQVLADEFLYCLNGVRSLQNKFLAHTSTQSHYSSLVYSRTISVLRSSIGYHLNTIAIFPNLYWATSRTQKLPILIKKACIQYQVRNTLQCLNSMLCIYVCLYSKQNINNQIYYKTKIIYSQLLNALQISVFIRGITARKFLKTIGPGFNTVIC